MTYFGYNCGRCHNWSFGILIEKEGKMIKIICKSCFAGFALETNELFRKEWKKSYNENIEGFEEDGVDGYFG